VRTGAVVVASLASVDVLVSVATGAVLVSAGAGACGVASGVGAGWLTGAVSVGTGCASCARSGVDENARAAAIAGRALVRRLCVLFIIMEKNTHAAHAGARL